MPELHPDRPQQHAPRTPADVPAGERVAARASDAAAPFPPDALPALLWAAEPDGRRTWFNASWCTFTGRQPEEETGDGWLGGVHPEDADCLHAAYHRACAARGPFERTYRLRRHDGTYRWILDRGAPQYRADGTFAGYAGAATDISDLWEPEASAREADLQRDEALAQLESLLTHAPIGFAFFDRAHRYVRVNDPLAEINGLSVADHLGHSIEELLPVNAPAVLPLLEQVFETAQPIEQVEIGGETPREPGVRRYWLTSFYPVRDATGGVRYVGATVQEITERKRAEAALAEAKATLERVNRELEARVEARAAALHRSEERFRLLFEHSPDAIFVESEDGTVLDVNPAACRLHGLPRDALVGRPVLDLIPPEYRLRAQEDFQRLASGEAETIEGYSLTAEGQAVPVEIRTSHVTYNEVPALLLHVRDVTERRRQQALVEHSEQVLAGVLTASLEGIAALEAIRDDAGAIVDFRWTIVNPTGAQYHGLTIEEMIGARMSEKQPTAFETGLFERLVEVVETGEPYRDEIHYRDERVNGWYSLIVVKLGDGFTITSRDITEQKEAEQALRESEERFAKAFHAAPVAITISTLEEGRFVAVNEQFLELTGYAYPEVIGRTSRQIGIFPTPEEREVLATHLAQNGPLRHVESRIVTRDGELRDILYSFEPIEIGGTPCILAIGFDLTERKRLEREVIEATELERRRIGQDLHDELGQQLTGAAFLARGLQQRLERAERPEAPEAAFLADLLATTLGEARGLSRLLSPVDLQAEGLVDALQELAEQTERVFGIPCHLETTGDARLTDNAVATHLYRIAQEAVNNAVKHADPDYITLTLERASDAFILHVRDDGTGISAAARRQSDGIGLRTMRYRADLIGATLAFRNARKGGTVVTCRIPLDDDA